MGTPFNLRMRNLFNPVQPTPGLQPDFGPVGSTFPTPNIGMGTPLPPPTPMMEPPDMSYEQEINQYMSNYRPETMARDRLNSMISGMPQRPENISGLRKLGSLLVGMSQGPEAQERLTFAPYYRELADWKQQLDPAMKAADLERYGNANERQLAYQSAMSSVSNRRAKVAEDAEKRRVMKAEADIERDKIKNEIARIRAERPDTDLVDDIESGNIFIVYPDGKKINTGLKHGDMSDLEKAQWRRGDIQERNKFKQLDYDNPNSAKNWTTVYDYDPATGTATAVSYNEVTGQSRAVPKPPYPPETANQPPGVVVPPTQPPRPGQPPTQPPTQGAQAPFAPSPPTNAPVITGKPGYPPTQDQASMENRIGEFKARNPTLAKWVEIGPDGQPVITQPYKIAGYQLGPSEADYQKIVRELYPQQGAQQPTGQFEPPAGAKPGGTWRQLPSGARVYQEP